MTHKIRRVDVEKYAYYVNKLRQNVGLETWIWRQIVTSQTAHTKYKWTPYATEWTPPPRKFSAYATTNESPYKTTVHKMQLQVQISMRHLPLVLNVAQCFVAVGRVSNLQTKQIRNKIASKPRKCSSNDFSNWTQELVSTVKSIDFSNWTQELVSTVKCI